MKSNDIGIKQLGLFLIFMLLINTVILKRKQKKWCWTRSMSNEPTFSLNPKNGGMNWGYCQAINKKAGGTLSKYTAIIETSKVPLSESLSVLKVKLYGDLGVTDMISLGDKFERGSTKKSNFSAPDVGKIQKIKISLEGTQPYRCKKITIKNGPKTYSFQCLRKLEPCPSEDPKGPKCNIKAEVEGNVPYEITVKASDAPGSGTKSPILLAIIGKKGQSNWKMFNDEGLKDGKSKTVKLKSDDVGETVGFAIEIRETGKFAPAIVRIKNVNTKAVRIFKINKITLTNPGRSLYKMNTYSPPSKGKRGPGGKKASSGAGSPPSKPSSPIPNPMDDDDEGENLHNPDGGKLSLADRKRILNLSCTQELFNPSSSNPVFGPDYPTNTPNYLNVLARCPANCHRLKEKILGVGIHPLNTPICLSALVDNAMSFYGGIISISVLPGLKKYTIPNGFKQKKGQRVKEFEANTKKSFSVIKVDNVDLIEKDIRVLNHKGELSHEGRVEVRREGVWGTICALGNNRGSAKRICKDIGYRDGEWKTPKDQSSKNYCKSFNGDNYCGAKAQDIHFMGVKCSDVDSHFNKCNKLLADTNKCKHGYDAIIKCYNENFSKEKEIPQGVVRIEKGKAEGKSYTGRLEMYRKKDFLPICNLGFTDTSALIACKQMGFEKGIVLKKPKKTKAYQLDKKSKKKFAAEGMTCSGDENDLKSCRHNSINIICKHDQDVVVKCSNGKGDPTGKSQYVKPVINPPPQLGKLKMAKYRVSCAEKGNSEYFRGDPGSLYIIDCPKDCGITHGSVWGTGIYTSNSHICRAAIHMGVIQSENGGSFVMVRTHGVKFYDGSDINNILTTKFVGEWPASITFSSLNSGYVNMYRLLKNASFISTREKVVLKNSNTPLPLYHSFLSLENKDINLPVPQFQWIPKDFLFSFSPSSNLLFSKPHLGSLMNFTILTRLKMTSFASQRQFIFSYSGCNGLNILINESDSLVIGDICNPSKRILTGYMMPLNDKVLFYMKHQDSRVHIRIFSYSTKKIFEKKIRLDLKFPEQGPIGIGRVGLEKRDFFNGKIDFFQIYSSEVDIDLLEEIIKNIKIKPKAGVQGKRKTLDNRVCVSPCTSNPTPNNPGAGEPPVEANPYKSFMRKASAAKSKSNGKGGKKASGAANGTYNKKKAGNIESTDINCQTNLNDKRFSGASGKIFRVRCKNCMSEKGAVFGTSIYHPLSSICKAASHAGVLTPSKGGVFLLQIAPGASAYNGSPGVDKSISATFAGAPKSFVVLKAPPLKKISCNTKANSAPFSTASISKRFVVLCPPGCSKSIVDIFGTNVYTDNSAICVAAIHYGMLSDKGGEISFMISKGESFYIKSKGFGITSKSKGPHIRSFKFLGKRSAITFKWNEDYEPNFNDKWGIEVHPNAIKKLSNKWSYIFDNNFVLDGKKQKLKAIIHKGKISNKKLLDYGSWIHLKNADWANGKVKFNFLLYDIKPIAVFFRYSGPENYYAVEFNGNPSDNIKLIKRIDGSNFLVSSVSSKILIGKWYRVVIIMNYDHIKVEMQSHRIRQHKTIFNKKIKNGLARGTLAFASKGNTWFYLNGISVDEHNPDKKEKYKNNKRSWHSILKTLRTKQRKIYCYGLFSLMKDEIPRCMEVHNYCRVRCDKMIPTVENILNFSCQRDCVRTANVLESKNNGLALLKKEGAWVPKKGEKCDFLPPGEKNYRMGVIKEVENKSKSITVKVQYLIEGTNTAQAQVEFPSDSLKRCGEALTARLDCKLK